MNNQTLYKTYFQQGTSGYAVVTKFYFRYADLLSRMSFVSVDDVVHEIFISLSKTDFAKVHNEEHYIMRAIKLQCWAMVDKAIRVKAVMAESGSGDTRNEADSEQNRKKKVSNESVQLVELEGMELLVNINLFKIFLNQKEQQLLNFLIDETERSEIARSLELNLNTLDTNIRRLRIKLADYLKKLGYSYKSLEKFT